MANRNASRVALFGTTSTNNQPRRRCPGRRWRWPPPSLHARLGGGFGVDGFQSGTGTGRVVALEKLD